VRQDETRCPFCGAKLGLLHALPVIPLPGEHRPAPKYGGPPFLQPVIWLPLLLLLGLAFAGRALAAALILLRSRA
jgi:hypothetical protein